MNTWKTISRLLIKYFFLINCLSLKWVAFYSLSWIARLTYWHLLAWLAWWEPERCPSWSTFPLFRRQCCLWFRLPPLGQKQFCISLASLCWLEPESWTRLCLPQLLPVPLHSHITIQSQTKKKCPLWLFTSTPLTCLRPFSSRWIHCFSRCLECFSDSCSSVSFCFLASYQVLLYVDAPLFFQGLQNLSRWVGLGPWRLVYTWYHSRFCFYFLWIFRWHLWNWSQNRL